MKRRKGWGGKGRIYEEGRRGKKCVVGRGEGIVGVLKGEELNPLPS